MATVIETRRVVKAADVAAVAGVHVGSVSRVMNGKPGVSDEVRKNILAVARRLNYKPSKAARSLAKQSNESIGWLGESEASDSSYGSAFIRGASRALNKHNHHLVMADIPRGSSFRDMQDIPVIKTSSLDGIIVDIFSYNGDIESLLDSLNIPFVFVNPPSPRPFNTIMPDDVLVARKAVKYLVEYGHKYIAYVPCLYSIHCSQNNRMHGYFEEIANSSLAPMPMFKIPLGDQVSKGVYLPSPEAVKSLDEYMSKHNNCTAFVVYSAVEAVWLFASLNKLGYSIPEQVSIVSCDYSQELRYLTLPVTAISLDRSKMGELAVEMLFKRIKEPFVDIPSVFLEGDLVGGKTIKRIC